MDNNKLLPPIHPGEILLKTYSMAAWRRTQHHAKP